MNTLLGILIGIVATIIVGRYYFNRTIHKQLTPYLMLSARIFAGVDKTVREQLKFTFRDTEIVDLHQLEFLIANDGERAISNCIDPLTLELPESVQVLDASILHRYPSELKIDMSEVSLEGERVGVAFSFPLLNKGDFFLVKLLLSGSVNWRKLNFHIVSDDLPRSIKPRWLPAGARHEGRSNVQWGPVIFGLMMLLFSSSLCYALYLLYRWRRDLFPYPLMTFEPSFESLSLLIIWSIAIIIFTSLGLMLAIGVGLEKIYTRYPRFPLPEEFRHRGRRLEHATERLVDLENKFIEEGSKEIIKQRQQEEKRNPERRCCINRESEQTPPSVDTQFIWHNSPACPMQLSDSSPGI